MRKSSIRKTLPAFALALIMSLGAPTLFAESGRGSGTSTSGSGTATGTATGTSGASSSSMGPTGSTSSDEVGSSQSSTMSSDCIMVKDQGKICGSNAGAWCNSHANSSECRNYHSGASSTDSPSGKNY